MADTPYRRFEVTVEYQSNHVSSIVDDAIQAVIKDAVGKLNAKIALLSNPDVVVFRASRWNNETYINEDMTDVE